MDNLSGLSWNFLHDFALFSFLCLFFLLFIPPLKRGSGLAIKITPSPPPPPSCFCGIFWRTADGSGGALGRCESVNPDAIPQQVFSIEAISSVNIYSKFHLSLLTTRMFKNILVLFLYNTNQMKINTLFYWDYIIIFFPWFQCYFSLPQLQKSAQSANDATDIEGNSEKSDNQDLPLLSCTEENCTLEVSGAPAFWGPVYLHAVFSHIPCGSNCVFWKQDKGRGESEDERGDGEWEGEGVRQMDERWMALW